MSPDNVIQSIQSSEQEAEAAVEKAKKNAHESIQKIEEEYGNKIGMMKELLVAEISEIAEKTKQEGLAFKESTSASAKKDMAEIESAGTQNKNKAVDHVIKAFNDHVGQ